MSLSRFATRDITADVVVDLDRKVALGGYGDVYKGRLNHEVDGHSGEVAVKVARFIVANVPKKVMKAIKQELQIWQQHRHPYILPLIGVYFHQGMPCAVSPWCDSGTILQYMKSARAGHEPELDAPVRNCEFDLLRLHCLEIRLLWEVAAGLAHLHAYDLAHGDIKASNILVKGGVAQLGDFGLSVVLAEHSGTTSSHLGTARWFAPESLREHAHRTQEADMWAFGCAMLEVRTLLVPYHQHPDAAVPLAIRKDRPFERPKDIHPSLWGMAVACWSRNTKARIASLTLAGRIKTTLKYATLLRKALGALPDVQSLDFGYPNSQPFALFSLASVFSKKDDEPSPDLTLAVATARKALRALEARGQHWPATAFRPIIRLIAITSPQLAEQLRRKLPSPAAVGPQVYRYEDGGGINSVAFLPDNRRIVSSSQDKTIHIWDIKRAKAIIGPLVAHTNFVRVAVHGSRIASCSSDGTWRVWEADSGKLKLGPIAAHSKGVKWIAYSRDGTHIATAGDDNRIALWDANTGAQMHGEIIGHTGPVNSVAFSEDGKRLVSGSQDNSVRVWGVASRECIGEPLMGHTKSVTAVCFSPDDKQIISSSDDGTIRICDAETRALVLEPLQMHDQVLCMALSPDGKRLASGSRSGRIALWDAQTGAAIQTPFPKHRGMVRGIAFSPDGRNIASASDDRTIGLWDATDDWKRYDVYDEDDEDVEQDDD